MGIGFCFRNGSTGTAIGSLGGIAAHNATLAWFGGGALAAGGGGMAAGALVFGGMVAIPVLLVTIGLGYKKTKEQVKAYDRAIAELYENIDRCKVYLRTIDSATQRAKLISAELDQNGREFFSAFRTLRRKVRPIFFFSAIWRWLRRTFTGRYFRDEEIANILSVCQTAMNVINTIDKTIFATDAKAASAHRLAGS